MSLFGREVAGRRHIDGLDVLRTLAIVGVTLFHMFPERLPGGYLGVSLFFVLTGFCSPTRASAAGSSTASA